MIANYEGPGTPKQIDPKEIAYLKQQQQKYNIPSEVLNDPNYIRQQQLIKQQQYMQQQKLMQQQQQQQFASSTHPYTNSIPTSNYNQKYSPNDLDSDEELLDDVMPRRKPKTGTEALAEFLKHTGPEDKEPQISQKKKKSSLFSFKKQSKKEKPKAIDPNRPKHIPLITENDGNGSLYSPGSNQPSSMGMGGMAMVSPEDRMMMQQLQSQRKPRKKTDSELLEDFLKKSAQGNHYMQQIKNSEHMSYTATLKEQQQQQMQQQQQSQQNQKQMMQSPFIQQQHFEQQPDPDEEEYEYKQAPVPIQQHNYTNSNMIPPPASANGIGERKPNGRHPPRSSSMVISQFLINQQGLDPYEVQQRIDEYALGINEDGEFMLEDEEEDLDEDDYYTDEDELSDEDSEVIRNTRHNAEMRPENCSFIDDPIPKASTNKSVKFCEEVGEISDSDYYDEEYGYEYDDYDEFDEEIQQMQNMTTQTSGEDDQQNRIGKVHVIHKGKLKDEDSYDETKEGYNMIDTPEEPSVDVIYPDSTELEDIEKEQEVEVQTTEVQTIESELTEKEQNQKSPSLDSKSNGDNQNNQNQKTYPTNQPRPRRRHVQIQTRRPHLRTMAIQTDPEATKEYEALVDEFNAHSTEQHATIESLQDEVTRYRISSQRLSDELKIAEQRYEMISEENKKLVRIGDEKQIQFDNLSAQAYTKIQDLVVNQQKLLHERRLMEKEIMNLREEVMKLKAVMGIPQSAALSPNKIAGIPTSGAFTPIMLDNNPLVRKISPKQQQQMNYHIQMQQQQIQKQQMQKQMMQQQQYYLHKQQMLQKQQQMANNNSDQNILPKSLTQSVPSTSSNIHRNIIGNTTPSPDPSKQAYHAIENSNPKSDN